MSIDSAAQAGYFFIVMRSPHAREKLKQRLDRLYRAFDGRYLETDPLEFVHRYKSAGDREVAGLIASALAYGRVAGIRKSIAKVLGVMGKSPRAFTARFDPKRHQRFFAGFKHRFNTGEDISCLIYFARQMMEDSSTIGRFFMKGYVPSDKNVKGALTVFSKNVLTLSHGRIYGKGALPARAGVRFFFPSPEDGSPCKRLNLYLRWMVRRGDGLDFGQWKGVDPAKLVIPLDTHIARISRNIGLTRRTAADWRMAEEITDALAELDPSDPVKYDFALCRLGILEKCPSTADADACAECLIKDVCVL
ncbi:MAG: TIGR02757 family protein [Deltaproteobacteria bacterium]|nr:TIGR02757 family protein [Deltaproteobacteria bacterium]